MAAEQTPVKLPEPRAFNARVLTIEDINHDVFRVRLQLPERESLTFFAGQYLSLQLPDGDSSYFSIASCPSAEEVELHIQAATGWGSAEKVMDTLRTVGEVTLNMPMGRACVAATPERHQVLVAAGTGFAQMKSIVEYLREEGFTAGATLFWGVRRPADMYLKSLADDWARQWPVLGFKPVVGDDEDNDWSGHHDQLVDAVLASGADWQNVDVIASGSPQMVYTLMDALTEAGLPEASFYSDVLEYAPRA